MNLSRGLSPVVRLARIPAIAAALVTTCAALTLGFSAGNAQAQADNFPVKPLRLMLPFGAGGPSDVVSRIFAERVGEYIGQPVVVDNRAGGLGQIGSDAVLAAGADGYTAIAAPTNQSVLYPLIMDPSDKRSLRTFRQDFKLAGLMSVQYLIMLTNKETGFKSVKDVIARSKQKPPIQYLGYGSGGVPDVAMAYLLQNVGGTGEVILYKSAAQSSTDLVAGRLQVGLLSAGLDVAGMIRDGRLFPLAILAKNRSKAMPNVPTLGEAGLTEMAQVEWGVWRGWYVPAATPVNRMQRINDAIRKSARDPKLIAGVEKLDMDILADVSMQEAETFWARQMEAWGVVVKKLNIKMTD